jgi:hypothetical protein
MIFRLTQKMAKKIKEKPAAGLPAGTDSFADWTAHLFTADRVQYILVLNTASLYSVLSYARGVTDDSAFINHTLGTMADFMNDDGFQFHFRRFIAPAAKEVQFSKLSDRRIIGSMNELVRIAKIHLTERQLSPYDASQLLNEVPMAPHAYRTPKETFAALKPQNISGTDQ